MYKFFTQHVLCYFPYHLSSNGLAERFIWRFKEAMRASKDDDCSLQHCVSHFLLTYPSKSHATIAENPASLMFKCQIHTCLDLLHPSMDSHATAQQSQQKHHHHSHACLHQLSKGDFVCTCDYLHQPK